MLLINPHLAWTAPLERMLEAQLVNVDGGLDVYGAAMIGLPVLTVGFNANLGWTHTLNTIDGFDAYKLTLTPDEAGYLLDGVVHPFDIEQHSIHVKQPDGSLADQVIEIRRAEQGPVITLATGENLALRMVGLETHGALEQWWDMARASTLDEFHAAIARPATTLHNHLCGPRRAHPVVVQRGSSGAAIGGLCNLVGPGARRYFEHPVDRNALQICRRSSTLTRAESRTPTVHHGWQPGLRRSTLMIFPHLWHLATSCFASSAR